MARREENKKWEREIIREYVCDPVEAKLVQREEQQVVEEIVGVKYFEYDLHFDTRCCVCVCV